MVCTDRDAQPASPWRDELHPNDLDRARGKRAIAQIRETLRNARPPAPKPRRPVLPDWVDDELEVPAAH
jgi:hypothetical protein